MRKAYAAYLDGVQAMGLQTHNGFTRAVAYLEEAVKLQPDFTEGHAVLSLAQLQLLFGGPLSPGEKWFRRLKRPHVGRWSSTRPRRRRIECSVRSCFSITGDREQAKREHQRAADLDAAAGRPRQALPRRSSDPAIWWQALGGRSKRGTTTGFPSRPR